MIFLNRITRGRMIFVPQLYNHTDTCPGNPHKRFEEPKLLLKPKRALRSGKVRLGFIPEEWFTMFYNTTGTSGPYLFGLMTTNYLLSKEIYVLEHEFYTGVSIFLMIFYTSTRLGPKLGKILDELVDKNEASFDEIRKNELSATEVIIKNGKDAQMSAEGQKLLIEAKKSCVSLQLEAAYRERMMMVYRSTKNRLDFLVLEHQINTRVHHKWMTQWILENVMRGITPELDMLLVDQAIHDLQVLAESKTEET